ncbi:MAG TPA: hypothetical protein DDX39_10175 [Bacteroidales bacterium]|nr:MAG: hypothetical protein A2W98_04410 [Bacteroidetes bacterium GWF2_33_38]OFY74400.1 MAG: hypothetical protein A2265_03705 [Bacteroidetes bacterium RIFOXYA12_FULL_33_9]HBF88995.1 hypothetical protein [Bacteroidales bacterium]
MKYYFFLLLTISVFSLNIYAQNIKRKASFGAYVLEINDSIAKVYELKMLDGILVEKIIPNTTASNLKLVEKDIILKVNDVEIKNSTTFTSTIKNLRENDVVSVNIIRSGKPKTLKGKAIGKPLEISDDYEIIYDEVSYNNGYIRTIITKPKNITKAPTILFIPGYLCYSLDNIGKHPYGQLVDGLTKKGYVVMRVEKLGEGDCINTPNCKDVDLQTEIDGFEKGLQSLKKYDFVDTNNIFIWGHSLGGIEAPILAERNKVKGIVVAGTGLISWYEYILNMFRFQNPLMGADYVENEEEIAEYKKLLFEYLVMKKTPLELSENKKYKELLENGMQFDGKDRIWDRNYKYWQQIDDLNQPKAFKNSEAHVLSIWSSADLEAFSEDEHKTIADIVNYYHPGKGTYLRMENTTHAFAKVKSMKDGIENSNYDYIINNFNPEILEETHKWIQNILQK